MTKTFFSKTFLIIFAAFALMGCTREVKSQKFLRLDSLRFGDSACYYETAPYGPIYADISDSAANARIDTVKGYYITSRGDTVIGTWYNARTNAYDTLLIAGNGKTNTWKLHSTELPKGIKLVRTNDSSTVTMLQTTVTIYGVKNQTGFLKDNRFFTSNKSSTKKRRLNDGIALVPFSLRIFPDREVSYVQLR